MIELARYKATVGILVAVLLAVLAMDVALAGIYSLGSAHDRAVLDRMEPDRRRDEGTVIARLQRELAEDRQPFGLILGLSTANRGIQPEALNRHGALRWSNLAGFGGSFTQLAYYAEPLLASDLRPEVVLIGGHAVWLAERVESAQEPEAEEALVSKALVPWFWTARNNIRLAMDIPIERVRLAMLNQLGVSMGVIFPGSSRDPWAPRKSFATLTSPKARIAKIDGFWKGFRWFEPEAYHEDSVEASRFVSLVETLQGTGAQVIFVLLPERPNERDRVPKGARQLLTHVLASLDDVTVIDHWDSLDNEALFYDRIHLNRRGRAFYSALLARELAPRMRGPFEGEGNMEVNRESR